MSTPLHRGAAVGRVRGLTLVELMIAMVLGLVILAGASSIFLANRQSYRTNEALSQVQEGARTAFELLARDLRQAGATGCDNTGRVANVLNNADTDWWATWAGLRGYDGATEDPAVAFGAGAAKRIAGTDSVHVQGIQGLGLSVATHNPVAAALQLNALATNVSAGDVLMVCDFDHAAIFQVTNANTNNVTIVHSTGSAVEPGNCSQGLGFPTACTAPGNAYRFGPDAQIARFESTAWYIGNNGRAADGGRSLYRHRLASGGKVAIEEVVPGVADMQVRYRLEGDSDFVEAEALAASDWPSVNAVSITLVLASTDAAVSTDSAVVSGRLGRSFTHIVTLRNRAP